MKRYFFVCLSLCGLSSFLAGSLFADSFGTGFQYQGRLLQSGQPASGLYDLRFNLWDAEIDGNQYGEDLVLAGIPVSNGVFQVTLDFGDVFDGTALWLQVAAATNDALVVDLYPRQAIAPLPYAGLARSAGTLAAPLQGELLSGSYRERVDLDNPQNTFRGAFSGDGSSLTNIPQSAIRGGVGAPVGALTNYHSGAVTLTNQNNVIAGKLSGDGSGLTNLGVVPAINVKAPPYNAQGDGVADDTDALQQALDGLTESEAIITVYIPPGTYRLTRPLVIPKTTVPHNGVLGHNAGYRVKGGGMSATKLVWSLSSSMGLVMTNCLSQGVIIEDLTVLGPLVDSWNSAGATIGMAIGNGATNVVMSAMNVRVLNCGIIGWHYGAAVSNLWVGVFDNCVVMSNRLEGLRFAGTHGPSVRNCTIGGNYCTDGYEAVCGIGVGFHFPNNGCPGDNAQILNNLIFNCTNGVFNDELNLVSINNHLERCGSYYTSVDWTGLTVVGGYTLDFGVPHTNGFAAQVLLDSRSAPNTIFEVHGMTGNTQRPFFNVTNRDDIGLKLPTLIGQGTMPGLWESVSNVTLYPFGSDRRPIWNQQMSLRNGWDDSTGISNGTSPAPWYVRGAAKAAANQANNVAFSVPHGMGWTNFVLEMVVQGAPGQTNMSFGMIQYNYSLGPTGQISCGNIGARFSGITNGCLSTFYWTNSFFDDLYPRRCVYVFGSRDLFPPLTNDLWIVSMRLFSHEMR